MWLLLLKKGAAGVSLPLLRQHLPSHSLAFKSGEGNFSHLVHHFPFRFPSITLVVIQGLYLGLASVEIECSH